MFHHTLLQGLHGVFVPLRRGRTDRSNDRLRRETLTRTRHTSHCSRQSDTRHLDARHCASRHIVHRRATGAPQKSENAIQNPTLYKAELKRKVPQN